MVRIKTVVVILKILANFIVHRNFDKNNYIVKKILKFQLCLTICFDTTKHSHSFLIQLETTMQ